MRGELDRAAAQARFYGSVAAEGSWLGVTMDQTDSPTRTDLRRANLPIGPVAVFGASNFPFMFGVAGHDTASALAAGCPVIAKAHPAHPRLSVLLGDLTRRALASSGAPAGSFNLVVGFEAGLALVDAEGTAAVAFTGSQSGGLALVDRAQRRTRPIPVYGEMGTVNPVVLTTDGAASRLPDVARGFVDSFTLGHGQFCTKPGLLLAPIGSETAAAVADALSSAAPGWLLTESIAVSYERRLEELRSAGAREVARADRPTTGYSVAPTLLAATAGDLIPGSTLLEECFGPVAIVVEYADDAELGAVLDRLQPSLAAAVASGGSCDREVPWLVAKLARQAGRVVVDGWPTGVATTWAQHHGGPWPATSRPDASSVGASAHRRSTASLARWRSRTSLRTRSRQHCAMTILRMYRGESTACSSNPEFSFNAGGFTPARVHDTPKLTLDGR